MKNKGITLIALVITIIVLLILAGVSIATLTGDNGIISNADLAAIKNENSIVAEAINLRVTHYYAASDPDIKTALQNDRIIDKNGLVDTYILLEQNLKTGRGSGNKDVYIMKNNHLYYYDKNGDKTDLGNIEIGDIEETDPSLFEVDDYGNLYLKDYEDYYSDKQEATKTWSIENLVIPSIVDGKEVKTIIFSNRMKFNTNKRINGFENLKTVVIPDSVTTIGRYAFQDCSNLISVKIPSSVTSIEWDAFQYCSSLADINIPDSVTTIEYGAFDNTLWYENQPDGDVYLGKVYYKYKGTMPYYTNIDIKEGTVAISERAFYGYGGLQSITIPDSVINIGNNVFYNCSNLQSITIPDSVINIGNNVFGNCSNLKSVTIPNSVTKIDYGLFYGCTRLTNITIPNSVTSIGSSAFYKCSSLTNITIPNSVTMIDESALRRMY